MYATQYFKKDVKSKAKHEPIRTIAELAKELNVDEVHLQAKLRGCPNSPKRVDLNGGKYKTRQFIRREVLKWWAEVSHK